ncbi:MAG: PilC/PilY family type IV pilus protein, partial [Pseudomonadota bacterium]
DTGFFADASRNFWSVEPGNDGANVLKGGAANVLPLPANRKLYTNNSLGDLTASGNALSVGNKAAFDEAQFGLTGKEGEPTLDTLLSWMRGADVKDDDNNPDTGVRYAMGDTLHSQPAAVVYGNYGATQDVVVYNATNDGYLHALDADTGRELWAFVPNELLGNMADLFANENVDYKNYGLDGDVVPIVRDKNENGIIEPGDDFVYIVFGMRRGGDNYYMLDVTDRNSPKLRWVRSFPEFGQTWSAPVVAKVKIDSPTVSSPDDAVLIVGAGYDTSHDATAHPTGNDLDGAGVFMLDLETGEPIWRAGRDDEAELTVGKMRRAIPSRISVIDLNGDSYADRMYAADVAGQIWRFDITNGKKPKALVAGGVIAQFGAEGIAEPSPADTRRFYNEPDVSMFKDSRQERRFLAINVGSGYRAHPLDNSAADRFYSLRDANVFNKLSQDEYNTYPVVKESDLIDVAGTVGAVVPAGGDGWMFTLPPYEKVLSAARTFDNQVYFVTFEPRVNADDPCQAGLSQNRLYRVNVVNGDPIVDFGENATPSPEEADAARVMRLEQGGIAPQPVFLFPGAPENCTGDACTPPPLACVGVECFDPDFPNNPVRTLWTQDGVE